MCFLLLLYLFYLQLSSKVVTAFRQPNPVEVFPFIFFGFSAIFVKVDTPLVEVCLSLGFQDHSLISFCFSIFSVGFSNLGIAPEVVLGLIFCLNVLTHIKHFIVLIFRC